MTGIKFEKAVVDMLGKNGYWAHRIAPDARGAQPFDVIAVGNGTVIVADCKVCGDGRFDEYRFRENQRYSFEAFRTKNNNCDNVRIGLFAYYNDQVYWLPYWMLLNEGTIKLNEDLLCEYQLEQK